ncbi:hypothetical protein PFISCL1PPCAC_3926, partial [Pristionchus fissidentatus]
NLLIESIDKLSMKRPTEGRSQSQGKKKKIIDLIVLTDSDDDAKANKEMPPPTRAEFAALQEALEKKEKLFRGACLAARKAELRAESAEKQLDAKIAVMDSVEKMRGKNEKLKEKKAQLKAKNEELNNKRFVEVVELTDMVEQERADSERKVSGLKRQLAQQGQG